MLTAIIFLLYLVIFSWLITRMPFFVQSHISKTWLISLFVIKICAGIAYGLFYSQPQYREGSDSLNLFNISGKETGWLMRDPVDFIKDLFTSGYAERSNLFTGKDSYWNDLKDNALIKLMAIINLFTGKRYFVNIIFFNFLFFFGPVALYRMLYSLYPFKKVMLLCCVFLVPSFLFWCSGLHKDGFIFAAIALAVYYFNLWLKYKVIRVKHVLAVLLCFGALFMLRNFLLFLLLPGLVAWLLAEYYPSKKWIYFIAVYVLAGLIFFLAPLIHPALNFPQYLVGKQAEFKLLQGNSAIPVPAFNPSFISIVFFFPHAFDIAFLQPHLTALNSLSYLPAALENLIVLLLMIMVLTRKKANAASPVLLFLIFFSFSVLIMTGYTVTFSAAVMRYKSIVLPMLVSAFMMMADTGFGKKKRRKQTV